MQNLYKETGRFLAIIVLFLWWANAARAQAAGDYKSLQSGLWSSSSTWQRYDGATWVNSPPPPSAADGVITITGNLTVTSNSNVTADQIVIASGSTLSITGGAFTVANGSGTDLGGSGTLAISSGTLDGDGTITIANGGVCNWMYGINGGSGSMTITAGGNLNQSGTMFLADTKTLTNAGTWTWTGGTFYFYNSSPVANNTGTFNISTDADISNYFATTGTFNNLSTGIINKIGSPGDETSIYGIGGFTNDGTININSSRLRSYVNFTNTGTLNVAIGASINFTGNNSNFNTGSVVSGTGALVFDGSAATFSAGALSVANIYVASGTVNLTPSIARNSQQSLNISGGTCNTAATLTFNSGSTLNWSGGVFGGAGTVLLKAGSAFNNNGTSVYLADLKTINNYGTWTWSGGAFYFYTGTPTINNYGTFYINSDNDFVVYSSPKGTFNNKPGGVIEKIGSPGDDTYTNGVTSFTNAGTINVHSVRLRFYCDVTNTGILNIDNAANINFSGGTTALNSGTNLKGNGNAYFDGAGVTFAAGTCSIGNMYVTAGSLALEVNLSFNNGKSLSFTAGTLNGSGNINFNAGSAFYWSGGLAGGTGTSTIKSGANMYTAGGAMYLADTRTFDNYGTWTWTSGNIYYYNSAPVINNYGTFNINTDGDFSYNYSGTGSFINKPSGIINKIGALTDETTVNGISNFTNGGTININSGRLRFYNNLSDSGLINVASGAALNLTGATSTFYTGAQLLGNGSATFDGAMGNVNNGIFKIKVITITTNTINVNPDITFDSAAVLNLAGGTLTGASSLIFKKGSYFNWSAGTLGGSGVATIQNEAQWNINYSAVFFVDNRKINNYGTCTWTGSTIYYYNGSPQINNYGVFNISTDADFYTNYQNTGTFINKAGGVINKIGSPSDETSISGNAVFSNEGTINVNTGNLRLSVNAGNTANVNVAFGSRIIYGGGTATFDNGTNISGNGNLIFDGSIGVINAGTYSVKSFIINTNTVTNTPDLTFNDGQTLYIANGTLNANGNLNFNTGSSFTWSNGTLGGNGNMNLKTGSTFTTDGGVHYFTSTKTLTNSGTWNWTGGLLYFNNSAYTVKNAGVMNITTDNEIAGNNSASTTFINQYSGTINKTGSVNDDTQIYGFGSFSNVGKININSGGIYLGINGTHSGKYTIANGGKLSGSISMQYTGTPFTNNGSVTLSNLAFNGSSTQSLKGTGTINYLAINNAKGVSLKGPQTINNALSLQNGKLTLSNYNLFMAATASLSGGSSTAYVVTNGTGSLQRFIPNNATNVLFPVGTSSGYLPATIQFTAASTGDNVKVKVWDDLYAGYSAGKPVGDAVNTRVINHTWVMSESVAGGSNASVTLQWNGPDKSSGFNRTLCRFAEYTAGAWNLETAVAATGSNPYTITQAGLTSFTQFGVINQFVSNINSFATACIGGSVNVPYIAVGSFNGGNQFTAQLSNAAGSFGSPVNIGSQSSPNSGTISANIPSSAVAGTGYRIRVISSSPATTGPDNGSNITISTCAVNDNTIVEKARPQLPAVVPVDKLTLYPNPNTGTFMLDLQVKEMKSGNAIIAVYNMSGQLVYMERATVTDNILRKKITLPLSAAGTYMLTAKVGTRVFTERFIYQTNRQ